MYPYANLRFLKVCWIPTENGRTVLIHIFLFEGALAHLKKTVEQQKIDVQASGIKLESVTKRMEPLITGMGSLSVLSVHISVYV